MISRTCFLPSSKEDEKIHSNFSNDDKKVNSRNGNRVIERVRQSTYAHRKLKTFLSVNKSLVIRKGRLRFLSQEYVKMSWCNYGRITGRFTYTAIQGKWTM